MATPLSPDRLERLERLRPHALFLLAIAAALQTLAGALALPQWQFLSLAGLPGPALLGLLIARARAGPLLILATRCAALLALIAAAAAAFAVLSPPSAVGPLVVLWLSWLAIFPAFLWLTLVSPAGPRFAWNAPIPTMNAHMDTRKERGAFPTSAGVLFGLGLGGFFDGIVLHQILQWHHMVSSAGFPPDTVQNLRINTFFDGLFHATTYIFVVAGLVVLWRQARRTHLRWSGRLLAGSLLMGFGIFNLFEGIVDHHLLGLHHVNETVPREQWIYWDIGFLVWGALMLILGWALFRSARKRTAPTSTSEPVPAAARADGPAVGPAVGPAGVEPPIPMKERRRDWEPRPGGRRRSDPQPV